MQIWLTTTEADDGSMSRQELARSEKEARENVAAHGDKVNGEAQLIEINTDKDGVIALFKREDFIKNVIKAFDIKNGKWKSRT